MLFTLEFHFQEMHLLLKRYIDNERSDNSKLNKSSMGVGKGRKEREGVIVLCRCSLNCVVVQRKKIDGRNG